MTGGDVKKRFAMYAFFAAVTVVAAGAAFGQSIPEGQSCGGLFCDLGIFGHKTTPTPNNDAPAPPVNPRAEAVTPKSVVSEPVPPERVLSTPVVSGREKRTVRKKRRIAKAATASAPAVAVARKQTPAEEPAPPPASTGPSILNPFAQPQPSKFGFRPLY